MLQPGCKRSLSAYGGGPTNHLKDALLSEDVEIVRVGMLNVEELLSRIEHREIALDGSKLIPINGNQIVEVADMALVPHISNGNQGE